MKKNTELLFDALKEYTDVRSAARNAYIREMEAYKDAKGSKYYEDKKKALSQQREAAVIAAQQKARAAVNHCLDSFSHAADTMKATPPTQDELNLLQLVKMREQPTMNDLATIANTTKNGLILAALDEIARTHGLPSGYIQQADTLTMETARAEIRQVADASNVILNNTTGANRIRLRYATWSANKYGGEVDPDELPEADPLTDARSFYDGVLHCSYDVFSEAVDGFSYSPVREV